VANCQVKYILKRCNNPLTISSYWNLIGELINNQSSKRGETFETYDTNVKNFKFYFGHHLSVPRSRKLRQTILHQ
jgi:hypothetical protein